MRHNRSRMVLGLPFRLLVPTQIGYILKGFMGLPLEASRGTTSRMDHEWCPNDNTVLSPHKHDSFIHSASWNKWKLLR